MFKKEKKDEEPPMCPNCKTTKMKKPTPRIVGYGYVKFYCPTCGDAVTR